MRARLVQIAWSMSLHTRRSVVLPHARVRPVGPLVVLRPHMSDDDGPTDRVARMTAYRRYLCRTQDVVAIAERYPGGMAILIHDREMVTQRLVGLLRGR